MLFLIIILQGNWISRNAEKLMDELTEIRVTLRSDSTGNLLTTYLDRNTSTKSEGFFKFSRCRFAVRINSILRLPK